MKRGSIVLDFDGTDGNDFPFGLQDGAAAQAVAWHQNRVAGLVGGVDVVFGFKIRARDRRQFQQRDVGIMRAKNSGDLNIRAIHGLGLDARLPADHMHVGDQKDVVLQLGKETCTAALVSGDDDHRVLFIRRQFVDIVTARGLTVGS